MFFPLAEYLQDTITFTKAQLSALQQPTTPREVLEWLRLRRELFQLQMTLGRTQMCTVTVLCAWPVSVN